MKSTGCTSRRNPFFVGYRRSVNGAFGYHCSSQLIHISAWRTGLRRPLRFRDPTPNDLARPASVVVLPVPADASRAVVGHELPVASGRFRLGYPRVWAMSRGNPFTSS